jgi:hypothetical protein
MKKIIVALALICAFQVNAFFTTAINFTCQSKDGFKTLIFYAPSLANRPGIDAFSFFDEKLLHTGASISIVHRTVAVSLPNTLPNSAATMSFELPENISVEHRQTGGYYVPIYTTYPIEFSMTVKALSSADALQAEHELKCTGR